MGTVDQGLAHIANLEGGGGFDVIPVLAGEGINNLLLDTLLTSLGEALRAKYKCENIELDNLFPTQILPINRDCRA